MNTYQHKFRPWRIVGETRVVASEGTWRKPLKWNREAGVCRCDFAEHGEGTCDACLGIRPRVLLDVDPFEDWQGGRDGDGAMTCRKTGEELSINEAGHVWPAGWPSMSDGDDWGVRSYTMADVRRRLFSLIDATPNIDWLVTTQWPVA